MFRRGSIRRLCGRPAFASVELSIFMAQRVFITVGEASGDQHAAMLIRELKTLQRDLVVEGIGGPAMAEAGAMIHYDTVQHAAMSWQGALRYFELRRILKWTRNHFRQRPPDLLVCIDSWSMNWHWAQLGRKLGIPVMYYVAPQMWASRPWRVKKIRRYVDRIACILPFEEKFFHERGVDATFVGHPLFDYLPTHEPIDPQNRFPNRPPVIGVIPGSRVSVAKENFRNLLDVCDRIQESFPKSRFLVPTMPATHDAVKTFLKAKYPQNPPREISEGVEEIGPFTLGLNQFNELVPQCDLCLTVSGTATLHAAGHGAPQIVVYRLNPLVWHLFARWVVNTRTFSLVNLLNDSRRQIVPEFIPWYGSNRPVAEKALEYLHNPELLIEQRNRLQNLIHTLNRPGASRNAARLAVDLMLGRATTLTGQPT
jgi:lipid-A-disaccharide synthase